MSKENEETLAAIKEALEVIRNEQISIKKEMEENNKIIMKRLNSLYEYNEINDMRVRVFNRQLSYLKDEITRNNKK